MTCEPLARTGLEDPVLLVAIVAVGCFVVGALLLTLARRRSPGTAGALLLVVLLMTSATLGQLAPTPASAAPSPCGAPPPAPAPASQPAAPSASQPALLPGSTVSSSPGPTVSSSPGPTPPPLNNSLTITQTSTMTGIAPGAAPRPITGLVVNNGPDDTFVAAVWVRISSVVKAPGARTGSCDATDYVLLNTRMRVQKMLAPSGGSATFGGARIGFTNKSTNQDACKGASVTLLYTVDPTRR